MGKHGSFRVIALTTTQVCPLTAHCGHSIMSHLMSVSGVQRTCTFAPHMSAFDPKRTLLRPFSVLVPLLRSAILSLGGGGVSAPIHRTFHQRGTRMAAHCARATTVAASGWLSRPHLG